MKKVQKSGANAGVWGLDFRLKAEEIVMKTGLKLILSGLMCVIGLAQTGCASGGYQLTRKYARFVNKQHIVLRVVLYILTNIVFAVTLLIDAVVFNTIDFWEGKVSANSYDFEEDGKYYAVKHSLEGEHKLRKSVIQVYPDEARKSAEATLVLEEQLGGKIQVTENGQIKAIVDDINSLPKLTVFNDGKAEKKELPILVAQN